jgi:hypothetical protein
MSFVRVFGMKRTGVLSVCVLTCCLAMCAPALAVPDSEHSFGLVPGSFHFTSSTLQAGAHSDWVTSFDFAHAPSGATYNDVRNIVVQVPAGFDASSVAVPTCTEAQLLQSTGQLNEVPRCPIASQVGQISVDLNLGTTRGSVTVPIYNMEVTSFGVTAELGFRVKLFTFRLVIGVRPGDLGLASTTPNISKVAETRAGVVTIWGLPAAHEHDGERGQTCGLTGQPPTCHNEFGGPQEAHVQVKALLSNPTSCGMFHASFEAYSWEEPLSPPPPVFSEIGPVTGCEQVRFSPSIEVQPTSLSAESPSGLKVSVEVPQTWDNPFTISTANVKDSTVTLPEGMTANPSLAAGLAACSREQYGRETSSSLPGEGCPAESKIGTVTIETPLLSVPIQGAVYIATPYDNVPEFGDSEHPNGSLLALYLVAKDPQLGVLIRLPGKITPDPHTGRLVTTFNDTPQQPFSRFTLEFSPRQAAPLITPPSCGSYNVQAELTPWSSVEMPGETPIGPSAIQSQPFQITHGAHEGPCPTGGVPPFKPQVISGTENNAGGSYSRFYLRILREDGEQELIKFSTILPPGLTGNLTGIPFCPDSAVEAAKRRAGAAEEASSSCPAASEIGHTLVGAGVGDVLAENPGKVYLAGPYHGAPLSIVSVTSAKVGPFDLGTVVIRFALDINPITAQVEISGAQSDPIPHIIRGIVVHVRDIRVYIDRQKFMINPTNCQQLGITDAVTGSGSNYADPANQDTVNVNTPFEAADCASLHFKPSFSVSTTGKTSKANGAGLSVKLTMPGPLGSEADIHQVKVELPVQLPSRLTTLQKACTAAQFHTNPAGCPAASVVGYARAITPILPVPLEGPAYFVSNGGEAFPNLIVVLQGYGITIDLVGDTFISKQGITSSTFKTVPDQPVTSFELTLPQGPYSALTANGNLCALTHTVLVKKKVTVRTRSHKRTITRRVKQTLPASLSMPTEFVAQNGMTIRQNTPVGVTGCPRAKPAKKKTKKKHG